MLVIANSYSYVICIEADLFFSFLWSSMWKSGFGTISVGSIVPGSGRWSMLGNVVFANAPQLVISAVYLIFNNMLTRMVTAHEYSRFAIERRVLRVSKPKGEQRTTLWLQLPYRYVLPLMTAMALLHWTLSRSLFPVSIEQYHNPRRPPGSPLVVATGYSTLAIFTSVIIGATIFVGLALLAIFRKLSPGIPVMGSCSLAISAACHPSPEDKGLSTRKLMYGVLTSGEEYQEDLRVSFSSKAVTPLVDGIVYT
jgi:hypothetical protein